MGNCLKPVQNTKLEQKTEAPSQNNASSAVKQQWIKLLLVNESTRMPSLIKEISSYKHPSFEQIKKDIDRTYPLQAQFNEPQNKLAFEQLLRNIALYYPRLGYIQGMNFVAGYFILIGMNSAEAFNTIRSVFFHPQLMLVGIYQDQFPLVRLYCEVFWSMFEQQSLTFAKRVKDLNIPDQLWIFQWFISLFIYSFPRCYITEILTFIWREKEFACVRLALAIVKIIETCIEGKNSFEDEFIECVQMIKDEAWVKKIIPIQNLVRVAKSIDKTATVEHAKKIKVNNKFSQYFAMAQNERKEKYEQMLNQSQRDRIDYYKHLNSGKSMPVLRNSSVTIIDDIEEKRQEHYYAKIHNSLSLKLPNQSFLKCKKTFSVTEQVKLENNLILTQSFYQK